MKTKERDSVDQMAQMMGTNRETLLGIMDEVKANQAKLNGCKAHQFVLASHHDERPILKQKFVCRACGGMIDRIQYNWFTYGLRQAAGLPPYLDPQ